MAQFAFSRQGPIPSYARDQQRSLVYQWETLVSGQANRVNEFKTLDACADFALPIWSAEMRLRGAQGKSIKMPEFEEPSDRQRDALCLPGRWIKLPPWARNQVIILHEMAHNLIAESRNDASHGPHFVGCLIGLLSRHANYDAKDLMISADWAAVRYLSFAVGPVPEVPLSIRLIRFAHGPGSILGPMPLFEIAGCLNVSDDDVQAAAKVCIRSGSAQMRSGLFVVTN